MTTWREATVETEITWDRNCWHVCEDWVEGRKQRKLLVKELFTHSPMFRSFLRTGCPPHLPPEFPWGRWPGGWGNGWPGHPAQEGFEMGTSHGQKDPVECVFTRIVNQKLRDIVKYKEWPPLRCWRIGKRKLTEPRGNRRPTEFRL